MIDAVKANSTLNLPRSKRLVESRWSLEQIATISASHQQKEKIKKPYIFGLFLVTNAQDNQCSDLFFLHSTFTFPLRLMKP